MLDENLPAFFLKPSSSKIPHHRDIYLSHHGSDPSPCYVLQNTDPNSQVPAHRNVYAAALFDAYNPAVIFAEVLVRPDWSQPTLSQDEIRRNNGISPPPVPLLPEGFTIQLYNPEQQVHVDVREGKWGASDSYEFAMPMTSFRTPSASNLDRGTSDPASLAITPKVNFVWRREGKLSKDLTCFMTGKSTDTVGTKKSKRDPDIAIALWRSMREMTLYESNLGRVLEEMEDPKGLEVVLLLGAVVIKDLYFGIKGQHDMKEVFNISELPIERKLSGGGRKVVSPPLGGGRAGQQPPPPRIPTPNDAKRHSLPRLQTTPPGQHPPRQPPRPNNNLPPPPPMPDPRSQWELDAETARLKALADAEAKAEQRRRREREKADEAERKRLLKLVEEEERIARKKAAEVERETERLRKMYGVQGQPQPGMANSSQLRIPQQRPQHSGASSRYSLDSRPMGVDPGQGGVPWSGSASSSALVMSGANGSGGQGSKPVKPKKSFFGLRSNSEEDGRNRLGKKNGSSFWFGDS